MSTGAIAHLLPHAGGMILVDAVESWDEQRITCTTRSHQRADNPLRARGVLPAAAAVEIAAQTMAIHGALTTGGAPLPGLLVAVADLELRVARIDDRNDVLRVDAAVEHGSSRGRIYRFSVSAGGEELVSGRLTVMLAG